MTTPMDTMRAQLARLAGATTDVVADASALVMQPAFGAEESRELVLTTRQLDSLGAPRLLLLDDAHAQMANVLGIPVHYYRRMLAEAPHLLSRNVNHWLGKQASRKMLRLRTALTDEETARLERANAAHYVRAVLSDRYRCLDSRALIDAVLPAIEEAGATIHSFHLGDRLFSLRVVSPERDVREFVTGAHTAVSERVQFGAVIGNSETGHSALSVAPFVRVLVCNNGLIVNRPMRVRHVGRRVGGDSDASYLSVETQRLDDATLFMAARDRVTEALAAATQARIAGTIVEAKTTPVPLGSRPVFEVLDGVSATFDLTREEQETLRSEYVVASVREQAEVMTRWTVSQALTATARQHASDSDDGAERRDALEKAGWTILTNPASYLAALARRSRN